MSLARFEPKTSYMLTKTLTNRATRVAAHKIISKTT